ncbi:hypothetical protein D3C78_1510000 [compost metagenome]
MVFAGRCFAADLDLRAVRENGKDIAGAVGSRPHIQALLRTGRHIPGLLGNQIIIAAEAFQLVFEDPSGSR